MKKNYFLFLIALFSCAIAFAQVPQAVPYQAVARNVAGNLIANQNISVRLSIVNTTAAGPVVYSEKHTVTTNQFGLFTVNLGQGTVLSGTFSSINWGVAAKYLKVEFDPAGGNSFVNMGTSQLLSVPYALFSGSGTNLPNGTALGNTLRWNGTNWIADNALYNNGFKIGLGTTVPGTGPSPSARLDIRDEDGNNSDINQTVAGGGFPALIWTKHDGTLAAPTTVVPGTFLGGLQSNFYNGTDYRLGAAMYYVADTIIDNWHPASIQFRTTGYGNNNNLTRMTIKHNGNVGIGTTNPLAKFDVRGKVKIVDGTEGLNKVFTSDATGVGSWQALPPGNVPNGTLLGNTLRWDGTTWIADNAIYSDGTKVGLGTTEPGLGVNPSAKIDMRDEDGLNSDISQTVAGTGFPALIWTKQLGTLAAPEAVTKNTFVGGIQGNYFNGTDYNVGAAMYYIADTTSANSFPASIQFRTTSVDSTRNLTRMTIKHNGKVGIGTTIPGVNGYNPYARLDIRDETGENSDINQLVAGQGIPAITWAQQGGTLAAPEPVTTGSVFGRLDGNYYTTSGYSQGNSRAASIFFRADTLVDSGNPGSIYFATARYGETVPRTNLIIKHNGNVGVGTQNPEQKFDVRGKVKIMDGTEGLNKVFTSDATGVGSWQVLPPGNVPSGTLLGNTLRWDGSTWIADNALYSDGQKIGLGTTAPGAGANPTAKLDIQDEDGSNSDISQTVAGEGGFPALVWTKQQGTLAAPTAVTKNTFLGGIQGNYFNGSDYSVGAAMYYIADTTSETSFPASIQFRTTSVDSTRNLTRMTIKHNGKVGIGTTIPGVNGYNPYARLDIRDETGENSDINQLVAGQGIPAITWAQQAGTLAAPEPITAGSIFGRLDGNYYTTSGYSQGNSRAASIFFRADTAVDSGNPGSIYFATTKHGQTIPTTNLIIKHNGNVGIGTQLPDRKLDVRGGVKIVDGTQGAGKVLTSDALGNASWQTPVSGGGGSEHIAFFAGNTDFNTAGTQSIPATTTTTVQFGEGYAFFNDGTGYNSTTNRFTPPTAGVYQLNVTLNYQGTPGEIIDITLRLGNGGHIVKGVQTIPASGSGVITLAATYNSINSLQAPIWVDAYATSAITILKTKSGFSGHLVYAIPQ